MQDKDKIDALVRALKIIGVYCATPGAGGYDEAELDLLESEFKPVITLVNETLREIKIEDTIKV